MPHAESVHAKLLEEVTPVVRAILMRKSAMSLSYDDHRADNVEAIDLMHDVLARLWQRLTESDGEPDIRDFKGFAASVTYNAWSDLMRQKYPQRASLKNRVRYFLAHQPRYAVWEGTEGDWIAGLAGWSGSIHATTSLRQADPRELRQRLPAGAIPARALQQLVAADWDRLLSAVFDDLGSAVLLDDLVSLVATLLNLREDQTEFLGAGEEDDEPADELIGDVNTPEQDYQTRQALQQLWAAVLALKHDYRCAYLLNIPGAGKSRGDIEVFVVHGVVGIVDIGLALALSSAQYQILLAGLELEPDDLVELAQLSSTDEYFCMVWKYLPLTDTLIGQMLELQQQQVINRRMLALRELARRMGAAAGSFGAAGRRGGIR